MAVTARRRSGFRLADRGRGGAIPRRSLGSILRPPRPDRLRSNRDCAREWNVGTSGTRPAGECGEPARFRFARFARSVDRIGSAISGAPGTGADCTTANMHGRRIAQSIRIRPAARLVQRVIAAGDWRSRRRVSRTRWYRRLKLGTPAVGPRLVRLARPPKAAAGCLRNAWLRSPTSRLEVTITAGSRTRSGWYGYAPDGIVRSRRPPPEPSFPSRPQESP